MRSVYNRVLDEVRDNLQTRADEREGGVLEAQLTEPLTWPYYSL